MQKYSFAFPSPALPTEGAGSQKLAESTRACAQGVYSDPQGKRDCGVGMSQFTSLNPCAEFPDSLAAGMNAHEERGLGKT